MSHWKTEFSGPWAEPVSFNSQRKSSLAALQLSILAPPKGWRGKALLSLCKVSAKIDVLGGWYIPSLVVASACFLKTELYV